MKNERGLRKESSEREEEFKELYQEAKPSIRDDFENMLVNRVGPGNVPFDLYKLAVVHGCLYDGGIFSDLKKRIEGYRYL